MLGWACNFEHLKRRSMARPRRASSSISASHSRVAAALRFLPAASERVVSRWWLMTFRFRSRSFCSRGIIGFLFGFKNEGVISQQRKRVGGEFVQPRIAEAKRWLFAAWTLLLPQNVGDVIGAESASGGGLVDGAGHGVGTVLTNEFKQFGDLTRQGAIAIGNVAEIGFQRRFGTESVEKGEQPVLGARPAGSRPELGQFGFESFGAQGLATAPRTRIADDLGHPIIDGDRTGVGLQGETAADEAMRHA